MDARRPTLEPPLRVGNDTVALGGTPADGDFARLLEAASAPAAHRLGIDPSLAGGILRAPRRGVRAPTAPTGADAAPPRVRPPPASASEPVASARPTAHRGLPAPSATPGQRGALPSGMGSDLGTASPDDAARSAPPDLVDRAAGLGRRAAEGWRARPLRDRIVSVAFALVALWIVLSVVTAALTEPGDAAGALIVIALSAFFVLRGLRRRRTPSSEQP